MTRKDAALCCCRLVANSFLGLACTQFGSSRSNRAGGKRQRLVEEVWSAAIIFIFIIYKPYSYFLLSS